jgi:hypothetical protein
LFTLPSVWNSSANPKPGDDTNGTRSLTIPVNLHTTFHNLTSNASIFLSFSECSPLSTFHGMFK